MHEPRTTHMDAAIRVLRYLKGSPGKGILLSSTSNLHIRGYCDAVGVVVLLHVSLLLVIVLSLVTTLYLGKQRSKMWSLDLQQKLSIAPW